jgi:hypothetical protein
MAASRHMDLSQIYGRSPCCGPGGTFYSPCLSCPSTTGAAGGGTVDTAVQLLPLPWTQPVRLGLLAAAAADSASAAAATVDVLAHSPSGRVLDVHVGFGCCAPLSLLAASVLVGAKS